MTDNHDQTELTRIHERLDQVMEQLGDIKETQATIKVACKPCQDAIARHETTLFGNGKVGIVARMEVAESGRTDTLSIKSIITLLAAVGTLAATLAGAIGAIIATLVTRGGPTQ